MSLLLLYYLLHIYLSYFVFAALICDSFPFTTHHFPSFISPPLFLGLIGLRLLMTTQSIHRSLNFSFSILQSLHQWQYTLRNLYRHLLTKSFSSLFSLTCSHIDGFPIIQVYWQEQSSLRLFILNTSFFSSFSLYIPACVCTRARVYVQSPCTAVTAANPISQMSRPPMKGKA